MEKITNNIAEIIGTELGLDNDRKQIIAYGAFAILQTILSIGITAVLGLAFGVFTETMIIAFTISIFRKYSGGVHASAPMICAIVGAGIVVILAFLICFLITPLINLKLVLFLGLVAFMWSYYITCKLAPVDSVAKPIKTKKKKEKMKKKSILILCVYVVIVLLNTFFYLMNHEVRYLTFSLCIYGGTVWQSFTLTHLGHVTVGKIDDFLRKIYFF